MLLQFHSCFSIEQPNPGQRQRAVILTRAPALYLAPAAGQMATAVHPLFVEELLPVAAPLWEERFKPQRAQSLIGSVLRARLVGAAYSAEGASTLAREVADEVKRQLKGEPWAARYKIVVQVVLGEQRGAGVHSGARCFWDEAADGWAQESFSNETLFCVAAAFATYMY